MTTNKPNHALIKISGLSKTYKSGLSALKNVDLEINEGEIFGLLGPNGAGKSTLIHIICGLVTPSTGTVSVDGFDIIKDFRKTRSLIGLVPQEIFTDSFETVMTTVNLSRGLFGKRPNPAYIESILRDLSLWEKRDSRIITLSGGMKRRLLIAKALSHEPRVLFLDEPTAGVDVRLRHDMWQMVRRLRDTGVTVILTTHYLEEAEEMADRLGVIDKGKLLFVEETQALMRKMGKRQLTLQLQSPLSALPPDFDPKQLQLSKDGNQLIYTFDVKSDQTGIAELLRRLSDHGIDFKDLQTTQSSLEEIFVELVEHA